MITGALKVHADIIINMTTFPVERTIILVIMYVTTFKTHVIVFMDNIVMCLTSHWLMIFSISPAAIDTDNIIY